MADRVEKRVAVSARRGPRGWWVGSRLLRAGAQGDADARDCAVRIAGTPEHRLHERAKQAIAAWWWRTREPALRRAVLDTGAVAAAGPPRTVTLALNDRMDEWQTYETIWAPDVLADEDPDVRERATAACENATGELHWALWEADTWPGTPLRDALLRNPAPPPDAKLNVLWQAWLDVGSAETGEALLRWGRPATVAPLESFSLVAVSTDRDALLNRRHALVDAIDLDDHPLRDIAARKIADLADQALTEDVCARALRRPPLAELCAKHRIAPVDPVDRVVFFLLTGQDGQRRALDPDGSLLALAYASAPEAERERVRQAMLTAGELDLVRVIVGDDRRTRIANMSGAEARYLAGRLAERREWDDLWAFVQDLPVLSGVELIRLFDDWAPRDDDARRVFELIRRTEPAAVERGMRSMREKWPAAARQARLLFHGRVNNVSFSPNQPTPDRPPGSPDGSPGSPDGPYLAAASSRRVVGVFDLRTARLVQRYEGFEAAVERVLHLGNGVLVAGERNHGGGRPCRVVRCADGLTKTLHSGSGSVLSLASTGDDGSFAAAMRSGDLLLGGPGAVAVQERPLAELGLGKRQWPRALAAHRASGRIALIGRVPHMIGPGAEWTAAAYGHGSANRVAFIDADTLVCADAQGNLTRLRLRGSALERTARVQIIGLCGLAVLPGTGDPVAVDKSGALHFLDAATLQAVDVHSDPSNASPTGLTVSPGGEFLAVGDARGHTDLFDLRVREIPDLVRRPLTDLVPRHLGIVSAALAESRTTWEAAAVLRLVEACLEHRFRFDIEIGDAVRLSAGDHDISL